MSVPPKYTDCFPTGSSNSNPGTPTLPRVVVETQEPKKQDQTVKRLRAEPVPVILNKTNEVVLNYTAAVVLVLGVFYNLEIWSVPYLASKLIYIQQFAACNELTAEMLVRGAFMDLARHKLLLVNEGYYQWNDIYQRPMELDPEEFANENAGKMEILFRLITIEKNPGPPMKKQTVLKQEAKLCKFFGTPTGCKNTPCKFVHLKTKSPVSMKPVVLEVEKKKKDKKKSKFAREERRSEAHKVVPMKNAIVKSFKTRAHGLSACDESEKKAVSQAVKIFKCFTDPIKYKTVRWADPANSYPTAVMNPFTVIPVPFGGYGEYSPASMSHVFVTRDPLHSIVYKNDSVSGSNPLQYTFYGSDNVAGSLETNPPAASWIQTLTYSSPYQEPLNIPYANCANSGMQHGKTLYAWTSVQTPKGKFFWIDPKSEVRLAFVAVVSGQSFTVAADCWENGEVSLDALSVTVVAGGVGSVAVVTVKSTTDKPGLYSFKLTSGAPGSITCNGEIRQLAPGTIYSILPAPGVNEIAGVTQGIRQISASVLYSATGQELYKGGKICMAEAGGESSWMDFVSTDAYKKISSMKNASPDMPGATGAYAFLKPMSISEFEMKVPFRTSNGIIIDVKADIEDTGPFLALIGQFDIATERDYVMRFGFGIEFVTDSTVYTLASSSTSSRAVEMAMTELRRCEQFMENPMHLRDLWESAKKIGKAAYNLFDEYGPEVAEAFATLL